MKLKKKTILWICSVHNTAQLNIIRKESFNKIRVNAIYLYNKVFNHRLLMLYNIS